MSDTAKVFQEVTDAIVNAIEESPNGVPAGTLYAMLCGIMELDLFNSMIEMLVATGRISQRGYILLPK